jgi:hypothetical protein
MVPARLPGVAALSLQRLRLKAPLARIEASSGQPPAAESLEGEDHAEGASYNGLIGRLVCRIDHNLN